MDELFITDILQQALSQDRDVHPMTTDVQTPSEIINLYDVITYQKGSKSVFNCFTAYHLKCYVV